jgi:hypothetical protein
VSHPTKSEDAQDEPVERPLLRIVKGDPKPEEVAALVAVVAALAAGAGEGEAPPRRSEWAAHHRTLRATHRRGPGAWRAAAWPT